MMLLAQLSSTVRRYAIFYDKVLLVRSAVRQTADFLKLRNFFCA